GTGSILGGSEPPQVGALFTDCGTPRAAAIFVNSSTHALVGLGAVALLAPVRGVRRLVTDAKVCLAVIQPVAVDVIDALTAHRAHNKPMKQAVGSVRPPCYRVAKVGCRDAMDAPTPPRNALEVFLIDDREHPLRERHLGHLGSLLLVGGGWAENVGAEVVGGGCVRPLGRNRDRMPGRYGPISASPLRHGGGLDPQLGGESRYAAGSLNDSFDRAHVAHRRHCLDIL